jgi:ribosome maturation factor RimP
MISDSTIEKLEKIASEVAEREGCVLYDLDFGGSGFGGRALKVYIDRTEGQVSIDDCTNVSRALNLMLDVEDPIPGGAYNLEVSTPGLDRTLRKPWHFEKAVGKRVWMKFSKSLENFGIQNKKLASAKQYEDVLSAANDQGVEFHIEGEVLKVPYENIDKAKMVFVFEKGEKKKPGKK